MLGYKSEFTRWIICDHCGKTSPRNRKRRDDDALFEAISTAKMIGWSLGSTWNDKTQETDPYAYCPTHKEMAKEN